MSVREISLVSDGRNLYGSLFTPEVAGHLAVMFLSGYMSERDRYTDYAEALTDEVGATCLTIDLGGHGVSEGSLRSLTAADHLNDAKAGYDLLSTQPNVDAEKIGVVGSSYGGYLAALLCRERFPKSILLRAPAINEEITTYDSREEMEAALHPNGVLKAISEYKGQVTIVESEYDRHVYLSGINSCLAVARNGSRVVIDGASHILEAEERLIFKNMLLDWAQHLQED